MLILCVRAVTCQVWMCGGHLLLVTCSHVGHVFRQATPYTFPGGTVKVISRNTMRLSRVWMDKYADFYKKISAGVWMLSSSSSILTVLPLGPHPPFPL